MRIRGARSGLTLLVALCVAALATAAPPVVNHQGFLTDASGQPLNGTAALAFGVFAVASGGSALWTESHPSVPVVDGVYSVELGSIAPFPSTLWDGSDRWLEVSANGETLTPRQHVASVPYALNAPIAGIGELAGKPCNPANPAAGSLVVTYGLNGAVTLSCSAVYTLTVVVSRNGAFGTTANVTSSPPGILCNSTPGTDCSEAYVGGTVVTLTTGNNANWLFTGWSGACSGTGSCIVTMDASKSVTANYVQNL